MALLGLPIGGFVVIFLASILLFGEVLVNTKGIFALIGTGLYVLYFVYNISDQSLYLILSLLIVGLVFIIIDGKFINHGFVAIIGLLFVMIASALPSPTLIYGVLVSFGVLLGVSASFLFLYVFPARRFWSKVTLVDQLSGDNGYNSLNAHYRDLLGKKGVTLTPFHPVGTINIEGKSYSATSEGAWLEADVPIKVISIDGTKIVVKPIEESPK